MKVYHGSTFTVTTPNLEILNNKTDFGRGFYTTTDIEQAKKWCNIKKKRLAHENKDIHKFVNVYEYEENKDLNILDFTSTTEEWLNFVFQNRKSDTLLHDYDIVIGPVADDNLYQVLANYEDGVYDTDETIKRLMTYTLSNQISFHTTSALKCIKYVETIEIGDEDE